MNEQGSLGLFEYEVIGHEMFKIIGYAKTLGRTL
jgi:hypothetical protein